MVDGDVSTASGALPDPTPTEPPDIMNDEAFNPPSPARRDTFSKESDDGSEKVDTCRICRSEGTADEPLFFPCKCSGSIKYVHQECLMEWLSHSHKKHCELCKTPFRFTKLYDANMPQTLPWTVFVRRACWHVVLMITKACRSALVAFVWLGLIPWLIRWVWRWLFWIADAAWARKAFIQEVHKVAFQQHKSSATEGFFDSFQQFFSPSTGDNTTGKPLALRFLNTVFKNLIYESENGTTSTNAFTLPQADPSILSSWNYLSHLTHNTTVNRVLLDVFEGQLITCVIITGFILVFLIREWVVQQQPMMNLENLANVQHHLREAADFDRVQADDERLRRQQELLDQARRRLIELQNETERYARDWASADYQGSKEMVDFVGWEALELLIDHATNHLKTGGEAEHAHFLSCAETVTEQIRAAGVAGIDLDEFTDNVFKKLATLSAEERKEWEAVLISEIDRNPKPRTAEGDQSDSQDDSQIDEREDAEQYRRPPMPDREFSSRATQIQRLLTDAEEVFDNSQEAVETNAGPGDTIAEASADDAGVIFASSTESWRQVTPPGESGTTEQQDSQAAENFYPLPITNAGPDAKVNIRRSGKDQTKAVPPPKIEEKRLKEDEEPNKLEVESAKEPVNEAQLKEEDSSAPAPDVPRHREAEGPHENNPFHPDGPPPERRNSDSFGNRVASAFREEFGLDEADHLENHHQAGLGHDHETAENDSQREQPLPRPANEAPPRLLQRAIDWFWGDIEVSGAPEPVPTANEERAAGEDDNVPQVAPLVPAESDQTAVAAEPPAAYPAPAGPEQLQHDPEVVAAAQQAGLDPEAVEDAEDLEGIFELIGLQGPIIGLIQTSAFCLLLVSCTVLGAVIIPYIGGKMALSLAGSPVHFLIKMPLQAASFVADFLIDFTLLLGGWVVAFLALATNFMLSVARKWAPSLANITLMVKVKDYAATAASSAAARLQVLLVAEAPSEGLGWKWAFLGWSMHAHASLRTIQDETDLILNCTGATVTWVVETVSSGNVLEVCKQAMHTISPLTKIPAKAMVGAELLLNYVRPLVGFFTDLSRGALKFSTPKLPMDPSLVYWDSTDRSLAILAGYGALAAIAAIYVAIDAPITKSESGRKTEKMIRDSLRQAGGVLKVILIISIEMLAFPLYCGLLLDVAFLPLFQDASVANRWDFAGRRPYMFCFMHWFVGTCYMFHFALFVGMCRKILRKGVLWFIRDPDDPTFHPVRDVLERNVSTQLRKIAFSALVYGALVILCLGGVIWTIGHVFDRIFPIYWISTEPVLEFPLDLLLYNFVTPLVIRLFKPSDAVNMMYGWWLRRCARALRLSHFLFDDRRKDEEGRFTHRSWAGFLLMKTPSIDHSPNPDEHTPTNAEAEKVEDTDVRFIRDGKYVLTPCNDQYRPPKLGEAYLHVDDGDIYIADKDGKKNDQFSKVYLPPLFRLRISAFMICLWMFSAFTGLCVTLVPLVWGRYLIALTVPEGIRVNDIYAYSLGSYILGGTMFALLKGKKAASYLKEKVAGLDIKAWIEPVTHFTVKLLKCAYVYGFLGLVLPTIFALLLQFYLVLPLHTWAMSTKDTSAASYQSVNSTLSANGTDVLPLFSTHTSEAQQQWMSTRAEHTFHILQDYALGLLYLRIATRIIFIAPASRAAEAFRRITADGYLNPNVRLATRFFVLPVTLLSAFVLLFPLLLASSAVTTLHALGSDLLTSSGAQTKLYRYSYPASATCVMLMLGAVQLGKATSRWRARIRDEVYLVGERLHNFGEKKPPTGTKSVVRKER